MKKAKTGKKMKKDIIIRTEKLVKYYGKSRALDDLSINVPEKSIYGLVGPNGAGKTTTLGILSAFIRPTSGTAIVDGINVKNDPEDVKKVIGILPQGAEFCHNRTALDLVTFYSKLAGIKDPEKNADSLLDKVGMAEHKNKRISEMSNGMVKLTGIAQALIGNPKIIMLDEATAGLDPAVSYNIRNIVRSLKKEATIIFSSHNLYEVQDLCDYVGIIHEGKLVLEGRTKDIVRRKKSLEKVFMSSITRSGGRA